LGNNKERRGREGLILLGIPPCKYKNRIRSLPANTIEELSRLECISLWRKRGCA
jgi:hypothetical protein